MRVAMYYNNSDIRIEEMPVPQAGPGELLMRVEASGICGSDVMEWYRKAKAPLVLGHEVAGIVTAVGDGVKRFKKGDRICVIHHVPCNTCHYCLNGHHTVCDTLRQTRFDPGGFAEYLRAPAINVDRGVFLLPAEVSFEDATFIEPLSCVLRGQRRARLQPGHTVLIIGSGISGLLHIQAARALGAGRIVATDITEFRLEAATRLGADVVINGRGDVPSLLRKVNGGMLADLVIVSTGAVPAITQGIESVERGGTVLLFAPTEPGVTIPISLNDLWFNGTNLVTTYAGAPADVAMALELIRARRVEVQGMITHRLPLAETGLGFKLVAQAQESIKVIIEPQK
ncbi:MAG: zinc-dependent dehydrogenase [Dehalococcoidia bacterium]|nr:zinc-dependent dehydrogenase [Dehalococcoidia bacterium]